MGEKGIPNRGVLSPPFLKGDLGGLSGGYLIPPSPPLEKGGEKIPGFSSYHLVTKLSLGTQIFPQALLGGFCS